MHPILFEIGDWPVYSYGVLLAAAYLVALQLAVVRARHRGLDGTKVMDLGIYLIIAALVGAKLMLVSWTSSTSGASRANCYRSCAPGGVFYGGLIAALVVAIWLVRRYQLPLWTTADLFAPGIALGHVIGRLGCLLAGCCYGRQRRCRGRITFTNPLAAANVGTPLGIPLHPTQLYDAGAELLILIVLLVTERRGTAVRRPHVLAVHAALRHFALRRRVLPRRRPRHRDGRLDVAVRLAPHRAARARDAGAPRGAPRQAVSDAGPRGRRLVAAADEAGLRLDVFLARRLPVAVALADPAPDSRRPRHGR